MIEFQEVPNNPFIAHGICIGGIYPFNVGHNVTTETIEENIKNSSFFCLDFPDREAFLYYRRALYDPEQSYSDPAQVLFFETLIEGCTLTTGRKLEAAPFQAHLTVYSSGFATIIFWIRLSNYVFHTDEIIELAALARGTVERINPRQKVTLNLRWDSKTIEVNNFIIICKLLEQEFMNKIMKKNNVRDESPIQFVHPLIYIEEVVNCLNSKDIVERYPLTITGLANLWMHIYPFLKEEEVNRTIENDTHPFNIGVNVISTSSTLELHPRIDETFLQGRLTSEENHYLERSYLSFMSEVPVIQFFILRTFDAELSKLHASIGPSRLLFFNPFYPFKLMYNAVRLTRLQQDLTLAVNQFRGIYLTRKSYQQRVINAYRDAFGTSPVEESIDKKLLTLQNYLNTIYSMLTTIFILLLSIVAVIFGIIQVIVALHGTH